MHPIYIALIVLGGLVVVAVTVWAVADSLRKARRKKEAWTRFAKEKGFALSYGSGRGGASSMQGTFDGVQVTVSERRRQHSNSFYTFTEFRVTLPAPLPGGIVVYKPNSKRFVHGGERGVLKDDVTVKGLVAYVSRVDIGDEELDRTLVIDADDIRVARAVLMDVEVKRCLLLTASRCGHIRVRASEVVVDRYRYVDTYEDIEQSCTCLVSTARALIASSARHATL